MTLAFIRSLLSWQRAMLAATAYPTPSALLPLVDLEKAAVDLGAAKEWVASLADLAKNTEKMLVKTEPKSRVEHAEIEKWRQVLPFINEAHQHALEHVASFTDASAKTANR